MVYLYQKGSVQKGLSERVERRNGRWQESVGEGEIS